jgi:hypothetical protein
MGSDEPVDGYFAVSSSTLDRMRDAELRIGMQPMAELVVAELKRLAAAIEHMYLIDERSEK